MKYTIIDLIKLQKANSLFLCYKNLIGIADIDELFLEKECERMFHDSFLLISGMILWGVEGIAQIRIDNIPYTLLPNSCVIIIPNSTFRISYVSNDFKGKMLMADYSFIEECMMKGINSNISLYMSLKKMPYMAFNQIQTIALNNNFEHLKNKIKLKGSTIKHDIICNAFISFKLELAHILAINEEKVFYPLLSHTEEIVNKFLRLLAEYGKKQRNIPFYTDRLFITPQYLSIILKTTTGKSTHQWLSDILFTEAKTNLNTPQINIQQIADKLNFSSQSSFGKFFKKYSGISPTEYRKTISKHSLFQVL